MLAPEPGQRLADVAGVRKALAREHLSARTGPSAHVPPHMSQGPARNDLAARESGGLAGRDPPRFIRIIVWLWALVAAGMFWFLELAIIPVFFAIAGSRRRYHKPHRRRRLEARQIRAIAALRGVRGRIEAISARYDPSRPALPPADDERR